MARYNQYLNMSSGEILSLETDDADSYYLDGYDSIPLIQKEIQMNFTAPRFRIFVLYPDESINYEIPTEDIKTGGSYDENYQDGQRRTLSFSLYNYSGEYSPNINNFWVGTRLKLDMGVELSSGATVWFSKGVYIVTQVTPTLKQGEKTVSISASDKFCVFENKTGILESGYEIETGECIEDVINSILRMDMGNGQVFDSKPIIYHSSFKGRTVQAAISKSAGDTLGSLLTELATQLSAEIFYNSNGNLVLSPAAIVTNDGDKPCIWNFKTEDGDLDQLSFSMSYSNIINRIVVTGSSESGVAQAVAVNNDPKSPICSQRVGLRTGNIINDSNIYSDQLAQERAVYELRQQLLIQTSSSANTAFNPFLEVNNVIAISDDFFEYNKERFLIQSVSCSLDYTGTTGITFSNINNLSTQVEVLTDEDTTPTIYSLFILQNSGVAAIKVIRVSSKVPGAGTGETAGALFNGSSIYYGDKLLATATPREGYALDKNPLSYVVSGNVTVVFSTYLLTFLLTISKSIGVDSIVVERTESPVGEGSIGELSSGDIIYYGDKLTVTATASRGYRLNDYSQNVQVMNNTTILITAELRQYSLTIKKDVEVNSLVVSRILSPIAKARLGELTEEDPLYSDDSLSTKAEASAGYALGAYPASQTVFDNVEIEVNAFKIFALSISKGYGVESVLVERTSTKVGDAKTGQLSDGDPIYEGDTLTVKAVASSGYGVNKYIHSYTIVEDTGDVSVSITASAAHTLSISKGTGVETAKMME